MRQKQSKPFQASGPPQILSLPLPNNLHRLHIQRQTKYGSFVSLRCRITLAGRLALASPGIKRRQSNVLRRVASALLTTSFRVDGEQSRGSLSRCRRAVHALVGLLVPDARIVGANVKCVAVQSRHIKLVGGPRNGGCSIRHSISISRIRFSWGTDVREVARE